MAEISQPLILLINPFQLIKQYASNIGLARLSGKKTGMTPLALPLLAALTPPRFTVRIVDEEIEPLPAALRPDLVGITALTTNIDRAFEIADLYRGMGVPVVMGGPYVSVCSDEALLHADCVVQGEADELWPTILQHFSDGCLQQRYKAEGFVPFHQAPRPRWDLVPTRAMAAIPVQVSRGCPFHCEFCLVSELFGHRMRYRDIDDVIAEVAALPLKTVFFIDDNLTANKEYAREFMRRLKPLRIQWFCMASVEIAGFPDLLQAMADCGCMHILIGFESLNPASLAEADKHHNRAERYSEAVARIHAAGINVNASMIVGFDNDTLSEYARLHAFLHETNLWYPNINILDVIPGSRLFDRIVQEGRWYGRPSSFSGGMFPVMHYMQMSQLELFDYNWQFLQKIFSWDDIRPRIIALFGSGAFSKEYLNRDVTVLQKILMTFMLLWIYFVRAEPAKRRMFVELIGLIRKKKVAIEKVVFFLLTAEGVHRQLEELGRHLDAWRAEIKKVDKGSWREQERVVRSEK
jgi:radical SAM superfamily enzyme YgiQ (UPF0313 family)